LPAPGERAHNVVFGWPELFYVWEGLVRSKYAVGPRVAVQVWPLSVQVGVNARFSLREEGRLAMALQIFPSFNLAGWGGSRAVYVQNYGFGRSPTFRPSVGPGFNAGFLANFDVSPRVRILASIENPVALWVWTDPIAWWLEWPIVLAAGLEFDVSRRTSLFLRLGGGPAIAFAGASILLGGQWLVQFGVQVRE
jgi:hypothetical protein